MSGKDLSTKLRELVTRWEAEVEQRAKHPTLLSSGIAIGIGQCVDELREVVGLAQGVRGGGKHGA